MKTVVNLFFIVSFMCFTACKGPHEKSDHKTVDNETSIKKQEVDSSESKNERQPDKAKTGIGPIKHKVELENQIDEAMASKGEKLYTNKCATCHRIKESSVGPPLGGVLQERSPQWVMNMILNPREMIEKNVQVNAMKGQYDSEMIDLGLSEEEARQIVEFLRTH